jgi:5-methylcytosine-specific restriction endonuclease McrA
LIGSNPIPVTIPWPEMAVPVRVRPGLQNCNTLKNIFLKCLLLNKTFKMINITKDVFINVCENCLSMSEAAAKLNLHYNTFKRYAQLYGCWKPNQSGKGIKKDMATLTIPLQDILDGKYPQYQTFKLKRRLFKEHIKENKCEICGITSWNGKPIQMELHHKDGNRTNHKLENLQILCPNCHSQTETFRAKNLSSMK